MTDLLSNAGFYVLKSAVLYPLYPDEQRAKSASLPDFVDITKVVTNWTLSESMDSPFLTGTMKLVEGDNLIEDLPIRGEEKLEVTYTDFYGEVETHEFIVYSIEDVSPASSGNDRTMKYTLNFTTEDKLFSDTKEIKRSFSKIRISDMARIIFDDYYMGSSKELEIEHTDGEQTLVIPNLRPDAAMQFLSRRAYSSDSKSSLFKFFETREKYYFCTHEYLIKKDRANKGKTEEEINRHIFNYSVLNDNTGPGQIRAQQSINNINFGGHVDSFSDMKQGTIRRRVTELDLVNRTRVTRAYDYSIESDGYDYPEPIKTTHSSAFISSFMPFGSAHETTLIADFPQIGQNEGEQYMQKPYQHYFENYTSKPTTNYHLQANAFGLSIHGQHAIRVGDIIELNLYKLSHSLQGTREKDKQRSGKYLVLSNVHSFDGDIYTSILAVTKGGLS